MQPLDLQSEAFSATGNVGAEGAKRPLGRPRLSAEAVLVREAIQNSWDARVRGAGPVRFHLDLRTMTVEQWAALHTLVLKSIPPASRPPLLDFRGRTSPRRVLVLRDSGTIGLCGPTRADRSTGPNEPRNFVDFFRNVGRPEDQRFEGGTFGYGKSAYFIASGVHTILGYSRFRERERFESRFMGAALGTQFNLDGSRYTGRHWWGRLDRTAGVVDPLTGDEAGALARTLGLMPFTGMETGTALVILDPVVGFGEQASVAVGRLLEQALWYAWPRMSPLGPREEWLVVSATADGTHVPVTPPSRHPQLRFFVHALADLDRFHSARKPSDGAEIRAIERYSETIGHLSLKRVLQPQATASRPRFSDDEDGPAGLPMAPGCMPHHVALMRGPRLVVRYQEIRPAASDHLGLAGVFVSAPARERVFADSEPPTHDEWAPEMLGDRTERSVVKVAVRKCREEAERFLCGGAVDAVQGQAVPLGTFSRLMGGLVPDAHGPGAEVPPAEPAPPGIGTGSGPRRAAIKDVQVGPLHLFEGRRAVRVHFRVSLPVATDRAVVRVRPRVVVIDGGSEEDAAPAGEETAEVLGWIPPGGAGLTDRGALTHTIDQSGATGEWQVVVRVPSHAVTRVAVEIHGAPLR